MPTESAPVLGDVVTSATATLSCGGAGQPFCAPLNGVTNNANSFGNGFGTFNMLGNHSYHTGLDLRPPATGAVVGPIVSAAAAGCLVDAFGLAPEGGGQERFWVWTDDNNNGVYDFFPKQKVNNADMDSPEVQKLDGSPTKSNHGLGMHVILRHQDPQGQGDVYTLYGHLHAVTKEIYDVVYAVRIKPKRNTAPPTLCFEAGHVIGVMGHSSFATRQDFTFNPHVHFEVKSDGITGSSFTTDLPPDGYFGYTPDLPGPYGYKDPWDYIYHPEASSTIREFAITVDCDETASIQQDCSDPLKDQGARVYAGPGVNYSVLGWTGKGQQFAVVAAAGSAAPGDVVVAGRSWYRIDLPNRAGLSKGWVASARSNGVQLAHEVVTYSSATVVVPSQELLRNFLDASSSVVVWDNLAFRKNTPPYTRRVRIRQGQRFLLKSTSSDGHWCELYIPKFYFVHPESSAETGAAPPTDNVFGNIKTVWVPCSALQVRTVGSTFISLPGRNVRGLAYDSGVLWAVHSEAAVSDVVKISKISLETGQMLNSSDLHWNGRGITLGGGSLWVADALADVVHRVDPSSFTEIGSPFSTPGTEPTGIAFDGANLWLADPFFGRIYHLSTTGAVLGSFSIPNLFRQGLEWDGSGLWTNTAATEQSHYLTNGTIDATKTFQGLPSGASVGDIAIGNEKVYLSAGDRIYIQDWPQSLGMFASVSAGGAHTCGVTATNTTYCWGWNQHGQLGNGTTTNSAIPVAVSGGPPFAAVSAALTHSCALTSSGVAYCWGDNTDGELGNGTTTSSTVPVPVSFALAFSSLTGGQSHTCGLTAGGTAYCWGVNFAGQLGNGTTLSSTTPVAVLGGLTFASLSASAGAAHTCGVTTTGAAYCWGFNFNGELGNGTTTSSSTPVAVSGGLIFATLGAGVGHTCGLAPSGAGYCWGLNVSGQLGNGTTVNSMVPVVVSGGVAFAALSVGLYHACGLTANGTAYCWGENPDGRLGNGTNANSATPAAVLDGLTFTMMSAGSNHTCGMATGRAAYCWGWNGFGQLGDGTQVSHSSPVRVSSPIP